MPFGRLTIRSLLPLFLVTPAAAQDSGTASGALIVGKAKLTLSHAIVVAESGADGERYRLLITDKPLPSSATKDEFDRQQLFLERKVQGLELVINAGRNVSSAQLYHPDLPASGLSVSGVNQFSATTFDAQKIAGKVSAEKPVDHLGKSLQYEATFAAPIQRRRVLTTADLATPPGKAAAAFLKASAAADAKALRALLTPEALKELDGPDGKEILKVLPDLVRPTMKITVLEVSGDSAVVVAEDAKQKVRFRVVRQGGQWKATLPEG